MKIFHIQPEMGHSANGSCPGFSWLQTRSSPQARHVCWVTVWGALCGRTRGEGPGWICPAPTLPVRQGCLSPEPRSRPERGVHTG